MAVTIPPRPEMPNLDPSDPDFANKQLEASRVMGNYQLLVQQAFNDQKQETETKSAAIKSKDDALSAVIRNIA
ncbi:MAG TPA: hypothetical protein VJT15_15000 [Pyrinomonadaceae bacterium]|nr:hypothetical protein [Pyrinomonadaceae bacterium]